MATTSNPERTQKLIELVDKGWYNAVLSSVLRLLKCCVPTIGMLHVPVDAVYSFKDARKAYEKALSGRARGKVVVRIDDSDIQG